MSWPAPPLAGKSPTYSTNRKEPSPNSFSITKVDWLEYLLAGLAGVKKLVTMPVRAQPWPSSTDHGNCRYGCTPGPAIANAPVGSPAPAVTERSTLPGTGLICHLNAGATFPKPESPAPRNVPT